MGPEMICEVIKYSISLYVNFKISNVAEAFHTQFVKPCANYGDTVRLGLTHTICAQDNEKEFINFSFWFQAFCFTQIRVKKTRKAYGG